MKRVYLITGAVVVAITILAGGGAAFYYSSAQTPSAVSGEQPSQIVGSVKVPSRASILAGLAKIDIIKAIEVATGQQSGTVLSAHLGERGGFLIYQVAILTADGSVVLVTVDAGNGNVLSVTKAPMHGQFGPGKRGRWGRGPMMLPPPSPPTP